MKKLLFAIVAMATLISCHKDKEEEQELAGRTVLIYMSAENNLGFDRYSKDRFANDDIQEMKQGMKTIGNNHLVLYVDKPNDSDPAFNDPKPYMLHFHKGELKDSISMDESLTADASVFETVIRKAFTTWPAKSYALGLWGHATGWLINNDSIKYNARKKAYGGDTGDNSSDGAGKYWMNIPSMAKALSRLPHLDYIFADCCNMMCLEVGYELRHVTDYLIGSPAEIPGCGAPYNTVIPAMFETNTFYTSIVEKYYAQRAGGFDVPLSVIKSSEMENVANATKRVLETIKSQFTEAYPDMKNIIHYYNPQWSFDANYNEFYDANDFILRYASENDYRAWKQALDKAVIYKKIANRWMTNRSWNSHYTDFTITEEKYGGVSMYVPQWAFQTDYNIRIQQMGWYYAAGYNIIGW